MRHWLKMEFQRLIQRLSVNRHLLIGENSHLLSDRSIWALLYVFYSFWDCLLSRDHISGDCSLRHYSQLLYRGDIISWDLQSCFSIISHCMTSSELSHQY